MSDIGDSRDRLGSMIEFAKLWKALSACVLSSLIYVNMTSSNTFSGERKISILKPVGSRPGLNEAAAVRGQFASQCGKLRRRGRAMCLLIRK